MRIQVLGDGGGIGDTLGRLSVIRAIKLALPETIVWFVVPEHLVDWALLSPVYDQLVSAPNKGRRGLNGAASPSHYSYIKAGYPFDVTLDFYDPAEIAETQTIGPVKYSRPELWSKIASRLLNVPLQPQRCRLQTFDDASTQALLQLRAMFGKLSLLIGLQPLAHWQWRSLAFQQVVDVVARLKRLGAQLILFHHEVEPVTRWAKQLGVATIVAAKPANIVELMRLCDGFISCDSGLFHAAGMLNIPTVGLFAQTDGDVTSRGYSSCSSITAQAVERAGLDCTMPCYRRWSHGCYKPVCERGCQALHNISGVAAANMLLKQITKQRGMHLPSYALAGRLFYNKYRRV